MMNPVPIVDAQIGMLLLAYNAYPANLSQWDELSDDTSITTIMYVTKVSRKLHLHLQGVSEKKYGVVDYRYFKNDNTQQYNIFRHDDFFKIWSSTFKSCCKTNLTYSPILFRWFL